MYQLVSMTLHRDTLKECQAFINVVREDRHLGVVERQNSKFNRLWLRNTGGYSISRAERTKEVILVDTCMEMMVAT